MLKLSTLLSELKRSLLNVFESDRTSDSGSYKRWNRFVPRIGRKCRYALLRQFESEQLVQVYGVLAKISEIETEGAKGLDVEVVGSRRLGRHFYIVRDSGGLLGPGNWLQVVVMPVYGTNILVAFRAYNYRVQPDAKYIQDIWEEFAPIAIAVRSSTSHASL